MHPSSAESWRPVEGYPGYEVSDLGRVRSFWRRGGHPALIAEPRILAGHTDRHGYRTVCLRNAAGESHSLVHRLVLAMFVGPCPVGMEGCHNNRTPSDNRLANLRWDTHRQNDADKDRHGSRPRGARHGRTKLSAAQIVEMRAARSGGETLASLGARFGITHSHVAQICLHHARTNLES